MFSYSDIYKLGATPGTGGDRHNFRSVSRDGFNMLDVPDTRFFKLLFYFNNEIDDTSGGRGLKESNNVNPREGDWFLEGGSGLLTPDWNRSSDELSGSYYKLNSAWGYLMNNNEWERATTLQKFVELLSSVSTKSPWYFQEITGLDEALGRENFTIGEERKKISIKCLPDSIDHRIESLLSMYRSIVWSHVKKCEVVPANLRKFDMGLFIYSGLTIGPHVLPGGEKGNTFDSESWKTVNSNITNQITEDDNNTSDASSNDVNRIYVSDALKNASYKYIEFHNCEFSMDSIKSGMGGLNNADGFNQEFNIDIYFDDCYEQEYNQYILKLFGDFFLTDIDQETHDKRIMDGYRKGLVMDADENSYNDEETEHFNYSKSLFPYGVSSTPPKMSWVERAKQQFVDAGRSIASNAVDAARRAVRETADKAANVVGFGPIYGFGNFYEKSIQENLIKEARDQASQLTSKAIGNISDMATKVINTAQNAIQKPSLGAIQATSSYVDAGVNTINNVIGGGIDTVTNIADHAVNKFVDNTVKAVTAPAEKLNNMTNNLRNNMSEFAKETNASVDKKLDEKFNIEKETLNTSRPKKSPAVESLGSMSNKPKTESSNDMSLGSMVLAEELAERDAAMRVLREEKL